jgi:hypothetical protein
MTFWSFCNESPFLVFIAILVAGSAIETIAKAIGGRK